jgi:hypothetical protein
MLVQVGDHKISYCPLFFVICYGRSSRDSCWDAAYPNPRTPLALRYVPAPCSLAGIAPARGTDSADAALAHPRHMPPVLGLVPPVAVALHLPAAATTEVRVTDELHTGNLRVLCGIEL